MYYTKYKDCGNGVMELTYVMHNGNAVGGDVWDFLNVPWAASRTSTLAEVRERRWRRRRKGVRCPVGPLQILHLAFV
jgi:hypothetical protein